MQVPDAEIRFKYFETGFNTQEEVEQILSAVAKSKKKKKAGEEYTSPKQMCQDFGITMDQLKQVIKAKDDADNMDGGKFVLSGKSKINSDGRIVRHYSRAGELMVKCIEEAYKKLNFRVPITGEYLLGTPSEGWSGAH